MNLFVRHYAAHPAMSENGEQVGGIVGFYNNLIRLITRCRPEAIYIIWESGGSKRKRDIYSDYKKGSKPQSLNRYYEDIPDSIQNRNFQLRTLIKLLNFFPFYQLYIEDAEADDAIGYLCNYKFKPKNKIIVSSDHDYYQLISEKTIIWSPTLKSFVDSKKVIHRYGVHPSNFCLAKSIVGDGSDNIPGVSRVGYKTLVKEYGEFFLKKDFSCNWQILLSENKIRAQNSKKKIFHNIKESHDLIKRNYKLVLLDVQNLSHFQVKKINEKIENCELSWKNIDAHRLLNREGIRGIDILSSNHVYRNLIRG